MKPLELYDRFQKLQKDKQGPLWKHFEEACAAWNQDPAIAELLSIAMSLHLLQYEKDPTEDTAMKEISAIAQASFSLGYMVRAGFAPSELKKGHHEEG